MNEQQWKAEAQQIADRIRLRVLQNTVSRNGGYLSQACSSAEIFAALYTRVLRLCPLDAPLLPGDFTGTPGPGHPAVTGAAFNGAGRADCDNFILSPAQYALVLYAALVETGRMDARGMDRYDQDGSAVEMLSLIHIWVKAAIAGHKPGLVVGKWIYSVPDLAWWRTRARSGGQLVEQCTHVFDLFRYLFGEPASIYTVGRKGLNPPLPEADTEDCSSSIVTFKNGQMATILAGCYLDTSRAVGDIGFDIYLEDAKIEYGFFTGARYIDQNGTREVPFEPVYHKLAMEAFVEAVRQHDQSLVKSSYGDAVKTLAFTLGANRSLETGAPVQL